MSSSFWLPKGSPSPTPITYLILQYALHLGLYQTALISKATYLVIVPNLLWKAKSLVVPNEIVRAKIINCYTFWIIYFPYTRTLWKCIHLAVEAKIMAGICSAGYMLWGITWVLGTLKLCCKCGLLLNISLSLYIGSFKMTFAIYGKMSCLLVGLQLSLVKNMDL